MNIRIITVIRVFVLLAITAAAPAFAEGRKGKPSPTPAHHDTVISKAGPTSITISDDKTSRTYTITQFTEVIVNGQKGGAADLKPGMKVVVTIGMDPSKASRINATDK